MDQALDIFDSKGKGIHVLLLVLFSFLKPTLINTICIFNSFCNNSAGLFVLTLKDCGNGVFPGP